MKLIYLVVLHVLALSTGTHSRELRAKAGRRSNRPTESPTSTPTASQSRRRRPKTSKRTRRPTPSAPPSPAPITYQWIETAKLTASNGDAFDYFGTSVSISDDIMIVGSYNEFSNMTSAYVFERDRSTRFSRSWDETAILSAPDGAPGDRFGLNVAVSRNIAIVGASNGEDSSSGSAYVFYRDETTRSWNVTHKLQTSEDFDDDFGESVAVSGNKGIVGAHGDNGTDTGAAYIIEKDESTGFALRVTFITASDGEEGDRFGSSVSISGNIAIVGAPRDDDNGSRSGSAYIFERDESTGDWNETAKLLASDGADDDLFGSSVSISGNIAIVGAYGDDTEEGTNSTNTATGAAYVFEKDETTGYWTETAKLAASDRSDNDFFGFSVSISGNIAIVGAYGDDDENDSNHGSAYVYERDESTGQWNESTKFVASDGAAGDLFGTSVSISGNVATVGAPDDDDKGFSSGSVYVFEQFIVV